MFGFTTLLNLVGNRDEIEVQADRLNTSLGLSNY